MSEALTLSSVRLGTSIDLQANPWQVMILKFPEPRQRITSREHADKDGAEIIDIRYNNSLRTMVVDLRADDKANAIANFQTLETMLNAPDLLIEYKPNEGSNTNFSEGLANEKQTDIDFVWVNSSLARITMKITCKPFWRGIQQTIAAQTLDPTPQKLTLGQIKGDVKMPCTIEIEGDDSFGTNIRIGSRETPMDESAFEPIKDFQGAVLAGAYNGKASDTTVDTNFTSLTGSDTNINGMAMLSLSVGIAVGDGGTIWATDDEWTTANAIAHGLTSQNLNAVVWAGGTTFFVCGDGGVILKSTDVAGDGSSNWSTLTSNTSENLQDIDFVSTVVGWTVGENRTVRKTTDGSSWATQTGPSVPNGTTINNVSAVDASDVFVGMPTITALYKTDDGGSTWSFFQNASPSKTPNDIYFVSATVGWFVADGGFIFKTIDGDTWTQQTSGTSVKLTTIEMLSTTVGWIGGTSGTILNTTDGAAWSSQTSGTSATLNSIAVTDASDVNIGGDGFTVLDTDDGGATWTQPIAAWALTLAYAGRYHVYTHIKKSSTGAGDMRVSSGWAGGSVISNPSVAVAASDSLQVVYLGEIAIPATNVSPEAAPTPIVKVEGKLDAGSETWSSSVFWLIPADGETTEIQATATDSAHIITDSDQNAVNKESTIVTWIGVPVFLRPGDNNIVISETTAITGAIITVKYFPLYKLPVA